MAESMVGGKRKALIAAVAIAIVVIVAICAIVAANGGSGNGAGGSGDESSSGESTRGVVELDDGTKLATYVDEDEFGDESADDLDGLSIASAGGIDFDEEDLEAIEPEHDDAGTYDTGLGKTYYHEHRIATDDEVKQLVKRLEGWWRPFVSTSLNASVRIHDGVCEEYTGDGQLIETLCTIGPGSVYRFDEGLSDRNYDDGPGYFIEGLFTSEAKSDSIENAPYAYFLTGAFIRDVQLEGEPETMQELQLGEIMMASSGRLSRIEAPDWAVESGLVSSGDPYSNAGSSDSRNTSSADERAAEREISAGKQVFTGEVVATTKGKRRSELGLQSKSDDADELVYLKFDVPRDYAYAMGDKYMYIQSCMTLGFIDSDNWRRYAGKRIIVSAYPDDLTRTADAEDGLYGFTGTFTFVKECEDPDDGSGYFAAGVIRA